MLIAQRAEASPFVVDSLMMRAKSDAVRRELIYDALTRGFLSTYRIRHAKLVLEDWFKQPTDNPWPYYWRGIVAEQTSENLDDAAVADFSRVLELDPDRTQARERLGRLLLKQNETAKARPHFEELFRRNENSVTALVGLARCEAFAGETNSARAHLDRALQIDSNHTEALRERASLAIHADGKPADAEPLLRKALAIQPHDPATLYLLVVCLQRMGNDVEARTQEQRYLELVRKHSRLKSLVVFELQKRPNDPDLLHEIGVLFLEGGLPAQEERGIYWLQRALEIAPRHAPTLKTLIALFESKNRSDLSEPLRLRLAPQQ
jgi:tetratricopeptide (TPR) repeat protein